MTTIEILVVDDEAGQREIVREILADEGHEVVTAGSAEEAIRCLEGHRFDLLITDLRMPGQDGVALLEKAARIDPSITVILMTAFATVASAVDAMKRGAHDYLQKPFSKDELVQRVRRVADRVVLLRENRRLTEELTERASPQLLGESPTWLRVARQVDRIAASPADVLITGESGTGKELVARRLHYASPRASGPFVAVNCAAIPETLAESELFGHEKGAFTHATSARAGRFEQADGGTLFLDEIGSMAPALQAKLLRVLQDRVVERVGAGKSRRLDVRVVSATNRDLATRVAEGAFREDLYHRLNVLEINLPPLRERREDIPLLAEVFRDRAAVRYGVPAPEIESGLLAFLADYFFPGNVRELEHLIEKMVALSDGDPIGLAELPPSLEGHLRGFRAGSSAGSTPHTPAGPSAGSIPGAPRPEDLLSSGPLSMAEVERRLLREAIRLSGGNLSEAAKRLGLSYKTLRYRVRKFGLDDEI